MDLGDLDLDFEWPVPANQQGMDLDAPLGDPEPIEEEDKFDDPEAVTEETIDKVFNERSKARDWCVTVTWDGVLTPEDHAERMGRIFDKGSLHWLNYQGEKTSLLKLHLQVFLQCKSDRSMMDVVKWFMKEGYKHPHVKRRFGTPRQAAGYCALDLEPPTKEGKPNPKAGQQKYFPEVAKRAMYGTLQHPDSKQGTRTDILKIHSKIFTDGLSTFDIIRDDPNALRMVNMVEKAVNLKACGSLHPRKNTKLIWIYGATGLGKDNLRRQLFPGAYERPSHKGSSGFWNGYAGESVIIYPDFDPSCWYKEMNGELLFICDRNPYKLNLKGSFGYCQAETIVFTSKWHYQDCFSKHHQYQDWQRRFRDYMPEMYEFTAKGKCKRLANPLYVPPGTEILETVIEEGTIPESDLELLEPEPVSAPNYNCNHEN